MNPQLLFELVKRAAIGARAALEEPKAEGQAAAGSAEPAVTPAERTAAGAADLVSGIRTELERRKKERMEGRANGT